MIKSGEAGVKSVVGEQGNRENQQATACHDLVVCDPLAPFG